jgi:serine/threonine-protein kinase
LDLAPGDVVEDLHVVRGAGSLALATVSSAETNLIQRVDLDTGKMSTILENASLRAVFESGHIAFERDETLWVAPFDAKRARLTGPGQARLPDYSSVTWDRTGDRVLYEKKVDDGRNRRTIALLDSSGETVETLLDKPSNYFDLRLSPDGLRLAFRESGSGPARIWVLDISSGLARPVTPEEGSAGTPYWTHDGRIAFVRSAAGRNEIAAMSPTPGAAAENILPGTKEGTEIVNLQTFSPDARHVIIGGHVEGREGGLYLFDVGKGDSGRAFFASSFGEGGATFSPDGRWVAYQTNGTGRFEVYLRPFVADDPESAPIFPVTRQGGANPAWAPDGRTLYFYRSPGEGRPAALYRVAVEADPELSISEPEEVLPRVPGSIAVARDDRFIVAKPPEDLETSTDRSELHLLLNWNLGKDPE